MSCQCQLPVKLRAVSRAGTGSAYACVVGEDEDFVLYQTVVVTHTHANGSWTVTTSITGGPISDPEGSCGEINIVSTHDDEFDYGSEISVVTSYENSVSLASIVAAATGAIEYGTADDPGWLNLDRSNGHWFSNDIGLIGPQSSTTAGETSTVEDDQVSYELSGYAHLAVTLYLQYRKLSDNSLGSLVTVTLTALAPSSGWLSAPSPGLDDGWYVDTVSVRIAPYNTTNVPL